MEIFEENKDSRLYSNLFLISLLLGFFSFEAGILMKEEKMLLLVLLFVVAALFCKFVSDRLSGGTTYMTRFKHYFTSKIMVCGNLEEAEKILVEFEKLAIRENNMYRHVTQNSHELFKETHRQIIFLIRYLESKELSKRKKQ